MSTCCNYFVDTNITQHLVFCCCIHQKLNIQQHFHTWHTASF